MGRWSGTLTSDLILFENALQAFIDYKNGIIPQIQIKYTQGIRRVHLASQRCLHHYQYTTIKPPDIEN